MAELKLSANWKIQDFTAVNADAVKKNEACGFVSDELSDLRHKSLSSLQWQAQLCTSSLSGRMCEKGFAGFFLGARFGPSHTDPKSAWAHFTTTLLDFDGRELVSRCYVVHEYTFKADQMFYGWGNVCSFTNADVNRAAQKDGSLHIRIDLTILKIGEILKCRELLRGLLAKSSMADFDVKVDGETSRLHKSVLAGTSNVFAAMFATGLKEAADGILTLRDTTPSAFEAFTQAIYFDHWNFLSDVDLTQEVLYLSEKYNTVDLKRYCDESLAEKVNADNALEILTKSAALCNAEKTMTACVAVLAEHCDFKESHEWLDFKKRYRDVALEILVAINDNLTSANRLLKRKCEEQEKASSSGRRRSVFSLFGCFKGTTLD